jgi:hypothetical protein
MLRISASIGVIAILTTAYVISPPLGWSALGTTFLYLVVRRARRAGLEGVAAQAR